MNMSFREQLILILDKRKISKKKLAESLNMTRQNLNVKLREEKLNEKEMREICDALDLKLSIKIEDKEDK